MAISLSVNNRRFSVEVDPATPLLWVLRDHLNLVGTKFGCGGNFCGACTVHVDGAAVRSCSLPVGEVGPRAVVTIEGLATQAGIGSPPPGGSQPGFGGVPPKRPPAAEAESRESGLPAGALAKAGVERVQENALHPVQRAWLEIDVPQCGYCQAGQIMTAAALLARNGNPTDEEIVAAMNGNLCRCGTYLRIRAAVRRAASLMASTARGE